MSSTAAANIYDVAVIGAGIVGTCSAAWAKKRGLDVLLIDRGEPGSGTSFGNAGIFAPYSCIPLNSPSLPFDLPRLLLSRTSPLTIEWSQVPRLTPWLLRFLRNCTSKQVERIVNGLAALSSNAAAGLMPLLDDAGAATLIRKRGSLYLYEDPKSLDKVKKNCDLQRSKGATVDILGPDEIGQMEPALARVYTHGIYQHNADQYLNPQGAVSAIAEQFARDGGSIMQANVTAITKESDGTLAVRTDGETVFCRQLVLAAGAFSRLLFGGLIEHLPLQTERGYHVHFEGEDGRLSRPVGWANGGFYMTPMEFGLRVAGTVELGGLSDRKRAANLRHIMRESRKLLPDLPDRPSSTWVGHRPTLPDSLPVIGRSRRTPEIILAFGHQHLGMTLGGITGKLVAELASAVETSIDLSPYRPDRF